MCGLHCSTAEFTISRVHEQNGNDRVSAVTRQGETGRERVICNIIIAISSQWLVYDIQVLRLWNESNYLRRTIGSIYIDLGGRSREVRMIFATETEENPEDTLLVHDNRVHNRTNIYIVYVRNTVNIEKQYVTITYYTRYFNHLNFEPESKLLNYCILHIVSK